MSAGMYQNPYYAYQQQQATGNPWSAIGPQLMGMPQLPPEAFIGSRNVPMHRLELANPGAGFSPFRGPVGSAAWNTFMAPGGALSIPDMMFGRSNMQMGPSTGSASSYYLAQRQQADLSKLRQLSEAQDLQRTQAVTRGIVNMQGYGGTDAQKDAMAKDMASKWVGLAGAGSMFLPEEMEDMLAPGGLTSSFSQRMYLAGTRARPMPGRYGLGVKDINEISKELESKFRDANGVEDRGFTRGFSMREFGNTAIQLSSRGLLDMSEGDKQGPGGKITSQKQRITKQVKEYVNAMDAMKDLLGNPNAPVDELMSSLDEMFGGGLKSMPAAKMEQLVDNARQLGQVNNLTNKQIYDTYRLGAIQAKGYGMHGEMGAIATEQSLRANAADNNNWSAGQATGEVMLQRKSDEERMASLQELSLRAVGSDSMQRAAAMIRLSDSSSKGFTGPLGGLVAKMKAGTMTPADTAQLAAITKESGTFWNVIKKQNISREIFNATMADTTGLQNTVVQHNLGSVALDMVAENYSQRAGKALAGASMKGSELYKVGVRENTARRLSDYMLTAQDKSEAGLVAHLQKYKGFNRPISEKEAMGLHSIVRGRMTSAAEGSGQSYEDILRMSSPGGRAAVANRMALDNIFDTAFRDAGVGRGPGGAKGLLQNTLKSLAGAKEGSSISDVLAGISGGVSKQQIEKVLANPEVKRKIDEYQKTYTEIEKIQAEISKIKEKGKDITVKETEELKKQEEKVKSLHETYKKQVVDLTKYQGLLTPELAAAQDSAELISGKLERVGRGTSKEQAEFLENTDFGKMMEVAVANFKGEGKEDTAATEELTKLYTEANTAKQKSLSKGGTDADIKKAVEAGQKAEDRRIELLKEKQERSVGEKEKELKATGELRSSTWDKAKGAASGAAHIAAHALPGVGAYMAVKDIYSWLASPAKKIEEEKEGGSSSGGKAGKIKIKTKSPTGGEDMEIEGTVKVSDKG